MASGNRKTAGAGGQCRWRGRLCVLLLLAAPVSSPAEDAYRIKAAFLYNFTKFVTWPAALEQQGGTLNLCLFDGNPFGEYVHVLSGRRVRNFELRIREVQTLADLPACNILFLAGEKQTAQVLGAVAGQPVLTISDQAGFVGQGGAIELLTDDNRVRFDVNLQRVRDQQLDMSSRLLQLARRVW